MTYLLSIFLLLLSSSVYASESYVMTELDVQKIVIQHKTALKGYQDMRARVGLCEKLATNQDEIIKAHEEQSKLDEEYIKLSDLRAAELEVVAARAERERDERLTKAQASGWAVVGAIAGYVLRAVVLRR